MSLEIELGKLSPASGDKASFQDVVAYLHGVTDAIHAMNRNPRSVWPVGADPGQPSAESGPIGPERKSARLTLRHGEAEIALEGFLVAAPTPMPLPPRGGSRLLELDGSASPDENGLPPLRGTLPYWAPAVSLIPARPFAGGTERPADLYDESVSLPYSALALSLVPIAPAIPSGWPEGDGERVSAVRLRAAPLSPELYALTETDDWGLTGTDGWDL